LPRRRKENFSAWLSKEEFICWSEGNHFGILAQAIKNCPAFYFRCLKSAIRVILRKPSNGRFSLYRFTNEETKFADYQKLKLVNRFDRLPQ